MSGAAAEAGSTSEAQPAAEPGGGAGARPDPNGRAPVQVLDDAAGVPAGAGGAVAGQVSAVATRELPPPPVSDRRLLKQLLLLMSPVLAEHALHILVGLTDTYLANHLNRYTPVTADTPDAALRAEEAAAAAAVGTIAYILWFVGLVTTAIGSGSTAIIARAVGARHRSLANSICGQSITAAFLAGVFVGAGLWFGAGPVADLTGLPGQARDFAETYIRLLAFSLPFTTVMFTASACLRGAGDTLTPATTMIVVDGTNAVLSFSLTYGWLGLPAMGFQGIALGTVIAYVAGGVIQFAVLVRGRGGIRLHLHRMRPHWHHLKRILRIGLPSGAEGLLQWGANFAVLYVINRSDATNVAAAAHSNTIRIESLSYMTGFAVATAASTMVGQSLGMRDERRATRSAYYAYAVGGGLMTLFGLLFILFGEHAARIMSDDPEVVELTTDCLFITGFIQTGFAAAIVFGGALRGAGDTLRVMMINLASVFAIRFTGVLLIAWLLNSSLTAIWIVLSFDLFTRGCLMYARFLHGGWKTVKV